MGGFAMTNPTTSMKQMVTFGGGKVLVTGAAAGIGQAIARRFGRSGADVVLVDVDESRLQTTADGMQNLEEADPRVTYHRVDLSNADQIEQLWDEFTDDELPDIVVNNAG